MSGEDSLDALRLTLAPAIADAAAFDGWSKLAVTSAAEAAGIDPASAQYAFSGGAMAMIEAWVQSVDAAMAKALPAEKLATMKIRERIRSLVQFRLDAVAHQKEALRRALAIMASPQNMVRSLQLGWHSADAMWRLAGDVATDYNHYTKRLLLSGVITSTTLYWLNDSSPGHEKTWTFLARRIDDVLKLGALAGRLRKAP